LSTSQGGTFSFRKVYAIISNTISYLRGYINVFIDRLPFTLGKSTMFIVVDNLSNYAYLSTSQIGIAHIFLSRFLFTRDA
jgi:hypothetical protein